MDTNFIKEVVGKFSKESPKTSILVGFDGFIDEILEVVQERVSRSKYVRIDSIKLFSERIAQAANLSANIELVPQQIKIGGNGPIMANAMLSQGYLVNYIGALGKVDIHPVFMEFVNDCEFVHSVTDPGYTNALEFADGKLMLGKMNHLDEVNWEEIIHSLPEGKMTEILENARLIVFNNWTMLNGMNGIMQGIKEILLKIKTQPYIFIDLADPQKRTKADIRTVLEIINDLSFTAKVVFSMNKRESILISEILDIKEKDDVKRAVALQSKLDVYCCVVHPVEGAAVATENEHQWVDGPYTPNPKLTTGAGDNFNAGFCSGLLSGLTPKEALVTGVYSSGFYVRNARSAKRDELISFITSQINA